MAMTGKATSCGRIRRGARSRAVRHALVAMRYAQVRNSARPSKLAQAPPGPQQCLLDQVFGVVERAEHAIAVDVQLPSILLRQSGKR